MRLARAFGRLARRGIGGARKWARSSARHSRATSSLAPRVGPRDRTATRTFDMRAAWAFLGRRHLCSGLRDAAMEYKTESGFVPANFPLSGPQSSTVERDAKLNALIRAGKLPEATDYVEMIVKDGSTMPVDAVDALLSALYDTQGARPASEQLILVNRVRAAVLNLSHYRVVPLGKNLAALDMENTAEAIKIAYESGAEPPMVTPTVEAVLGSMCQFKDLRNVEVLVEWLSTSTVGLSAQAYEMLFELGAKVKTTPRILRRWQELSKLAGHPLTARGTELLIQAYAKAGRPDFALKLWDQERERLRLVTLPMFKVLLGCVSARDGKGNVEMARLVWRAARKAGFTPDSEMYDTMVALHADFMDLKTIEKLLDAQIARGYQPDPGVFTDVVRRLAARGNYRNMRKLKKIMIDSRGLHTTVEHHNAFIKAYARCHPPLPESARIEFERLLEAGHEPNLQTFTFLHMAVGGKDAPGENLYRICERLAIEVPESFVDTLRGDWTCADCGNVNWWKRTACNRCGAEKPAENETQEIEM